MSGISEGTDVLTDFNIEGEMEEEEKASNPFMPRPRKKQDNNKKK